MPQLSTGCFQWGKGIVSYVHYPELHSFVPFADSSKDDDLLPAGTEDYVHIRIQQRDSRKSLTTLQGIADDYDRKKLGKSFKKNFTKRSKMAEE